jgi:hypothetical protein
MVAVAIQTVPPFKVRIKLKRYQIFSMHNVAQRIALARVSRTPCSYAEVAGTSLSRAAAQFRSGNQESDSKIAS